MCEKPAKWKAVRKERERILDRDKLSNAMFDVTSAEQRQIVDLNYLADSIIRELEKE